MSCLSQLIEDLWKKLFSTSLSNNSLIIYLDPSTSSHWLCSIMCKWHLRVKLYRCSRGVLILLYLHEPYVDSTPWEENYQWRYRRDEEATGYQHSPKEITFRESNTSAVSASDSLDRHWCLSLLFILHFWKWLKNTDGIWIRQGACALKCQAGQEWYNKPVNDVPL